MAAKSAPKQKVISPPPKIALAKLRRAKALQAKAAVTALAQVPAPTHTNGPALTPSQVLEGALDAARSKLSKPHASAPHAAVPPLVVAELSRSEEAPAGSPRQVLAGLRNKSLKLQPRRGIRIYDLRENHCRWVLNERGEEACFCGAPRVGTCSWCAEHRKIVYPRAGGPDKKGEPAPTQPGPARPA